MFIKKELFEKKVPEIQFPRYIMEQKEEVEKRLAKLSKAQEKLQYLLSKFQEDCSHDNEVRAMKADSETAFAIGRGTLKYFLCLNCGRIRKPREGIPHNVCIICDGEMEMDGYIPGQGGGIHVYKCEWCGHTEESG